MAKITPEHWSPYIVETLTTKNNIISQGMVDNFTDQVISKGGKRYYAPYQKDLRSIANAQKITAATTLTPTTTEDYEVVHIAVHKGDSYYFTEYDEITRGQKEIEVARLQLAEIAGEAIQDSLIAAVKGAFATALSTSHIYDATTLDDGLFTTKAVTRGLREKFGEDMQKFSWYIMHSAIYEDLMVQGLASYVDAGEFGEKILYQGKIAQFLGKQVFINDTLCAPDTGVYPTFIGYGRPFYLGWQRQLRVKEDENILEGGGRHEIAWYVDFVPGVKGISWNSATDDPDDTDLETGSNWAKKFQDKNITILQLKTLKAA